MEGKLARIAVAATLTATVMAMAPVASAGGGSDVIREGSCSGRSDWKLKVGPENGRLEVEFEVDTNVVGQRWRVRIFHDANRIFAARRVTRAPSGSFEVRLRAANTAGRDPFRGRAWNPSTGEVCVGRASI